MMRWPHFLVLMPMEIRFDRVLKILEQPMDGFDVPTTATSWGSNERLLLLWPIKVDIRLLLIKGWDI